MTRTGSVVARDAYTMKHLEAWLNAEVNGDSCRDEVRASMLNVYDDDPEYWMSQSWWNLFDRAKCMDILRRWM